MGQVLSAKLETRQNSLEQRYENRRYLCLQVAGNIDSEENFNATVRDLSRTGFLMDSSIDLSRGEMIQVEFPRRGRVSAEVAWTDGRLAGCRFIQPISSGSVSAALLGSLPNLRPEMAGGPSGEFHQGYGNDLSLRQKALTLLGLAVLAWGVVAGLVYMGLTLFQA
jgi:hypothetical protein